MCVLKIIFRLRAHRGLDGNRLRPVFLKLRPTTRLRRRDDSGRRLDGDSDLYDRLPSYFVLGWPPARKVLAQVRFLLDCLSYWFFSVSVFRRLVVGRCASTGAFDRRGVPQRGLDRPRLRCRHGIFRGMAVAKDHRRQQAQNIDRAKPSKSARPRKAQHQLSECTR